jgi:uncharacterized coiled-coil protein SlyX
MQTTKMTDALSALSAFIAEQNLEPENVQCLIDAMTERKLDFTYANLHLVHKQLSENYWAHEAEQAKNPTKLSKQLIESWDCATMKKHLNNPAMAREIERALKERT